VTAGTAQLYATSCLFSHRPPPTSPLFPYTTLFRSARLLPSRSPHGSAGASPSPVRGFRQGTTPPHARAALTTALSFSSPVFATRSEEHTSELQSQSNLVCRLLLEKKKTIHHPRHTR